MIESYLQAVERQLKLGPAKTHTILTEIRGTLTDLIARLREKGYTAEEAEHEALSCFGPAPLLARTFRKAHGIAPKPLRILTYILAIIGAFWFLLALYICYMLCKLALAHGHGFYFFANNTEHPSGWSLHRWMRDVIVGSLCVLSTTFSLGLVVFVRKRRHYRWHWVSGLATLLLLFNGGLMVGVANIVSSYFDPFECFSDTAEIQSYCVIPNLNQLNANNLVLKPASDQPTSPIYIPLLAIDQETTYVVLQIADLTAGGARTVRLFDNRNREYASVVSMGWLPGSPERVMPWSIPVRGIYYFAPLRTDAHEAVVRFYDNNQNVVESITISLRSIPWSKRPHAPFLYDTSHNIYSGVPNPAYW